MGRTDSLAVAEQAPSDSGRIPVADSESRPAPRLQWDATWSLKRRLLAAQDAVAVLDLDSNVEMKTKDGGKFSYKGITAAQVVARAKSSLIRHGILYTPEVDKGSTILNGNKTTIWIIGHFENVDKPEDFMDRGAWGSGTDNSDNGYAKAFTNANKQILTKTLNMTTVEDDTQTAVEHEPESKSSAVRNAEAVTDATVKAWADAFREALRGCTTKQQLGKVRAENAHMMKNPSIPQPTKDYFADMISELESVLS